MHLSIVIVVIVATSIAGAFSHKGEDGSRGKCMDEMRQLMSCCSVPMNENMAGSKCPQESEQSPKGHCKYFECMFKEKGYMTETGELDKEKITHATEEYFKDHPDFQKVSREAVDKAFEEVNKHKKGDHKECNRNAMISVFQFMNHLVRNCPASKWTNSQQCNDLKASDACSKKPRSD